MCTPPSLAQRVEPLPHGEALLPPPARAGRDRGLQLAAEAHETEQVLRPTQARLRAVVVDLDVDVHL